MASSNLAGQDVRAYLMRRFVQFKHLRILEFRKMLPRSPVGKILRKYFLKEPAEGLPS